MTPVVAMAGAAMAGAAMAGAARTAPALQGTGMLAALTQGADLPTAMGAA